MSELANLSFTRRGSGRRLLAIQGLSATQHHWGEEFLAEAERHFDLVTYDHREIGGSPRRGANFTMRDLAQDAADLIEALGWQGAGVFGVSMGGMVAQELGLLRPDLVDYLVLGCTRISGKMFGRRDDPSTMQLAKAYVHGDPEATRRKMFELSFSRAYVERDESWPIYLEMTTEQVKSGTSLRQISAVNGFDGRERVTALRMPTLILHGDADEMIPYAEGAELAQSIVSSRFETVEGAGHFFWAERPEWTADIIDDFAHEVAANAS